MPWLSKFSHVRISVLEKERKVIIQQTKPADGIPTVDDGWAVITYTSLSQELCPSRWDGSRGGKRELTAVFVKNQVYTDKILVGLTLKLNFLYMLTSEFYEGLKGGWELLRLSINVMELRLTFFGASYAPCAPDHILQYLGPNVLTKTIFPSCRVCSIYDPHRDSIQRNRDYFFSSTAY